MYRTVREGDASLQYTILPQRDDVPHVLVDTMTLRHAVKRRGLRSSCCACGPWGLRSRPLLLLGAVLALGCCAVLVAALLPALASASDLEAALQNAFTLGGAGQTASINPNVHHPAGRHHGEDADERRPHRPPRPARPFSEEDEDDAGDDYPSGGQEVAMVSAPELPPLPPADIAYNAPVAARTVPTEPPFKSFKGTAKARDDHDDDENDDDDDDLSFESRSIEVAARRMHDVRQSAVQPNPPGLPPSLLPQRQPPAAPAGLMLDPMMLGDAPMPPVRSHHKTNNGLYTNEDDLDHNILDIQPQRSAHARASTRIFVEALLPSLPGQGEPEPPQRRSWTPSASFFHWTDWQQPPVKKLALAVGVVTGLCLCVALAVLVRRRRSLRSRRPCEDPPGLQHEVHALHALHSGTRTTARRESRGDAALDGDVGTTQDLLASSEEEA